MQTILLARHAMRCRFEVALHGDDPVFLRAAGEEALAEVERLDAQLSAFEPASEISAINARAGVGPVRVSPILFDLLRRCRDLSHDTLGAFDVTVGPLLHCWGFREEKAAPPAAEAIGEALGRVGMEHVLLDEDALTVRFARPGMSLDLGGVGKGYAVQAAAEVLREAGVESALIHAGTSSVYALGAPREDAAWSVAIARPGGRLQIADCRLQTAGGPDLPTSCSDPEHLFHVVHLHDRALSVSGARGRTVSFDGRAYSHILDPRTGCPAEGPLLAAVAHPSAVVAEALSTGLLVGGEDLWWEIAARWPEAEVLIAGG